MKSNCLFANDQQLLSASKNGDEQAFRLLFEKYWDDLFRIAFKRLHCADDAKDILQDVFLSLWNNIGSVTVEDSLGGYLYTALRNRIFNHFEKHQSRLRSLMKQPYDPVQTEDNIWNAFITKELEQHIASEVDKMPEKMRHIYLLSKEARLTNAEIASLLDLSNQTVKNQLHNALKRLRQSLANTNFSFSFPLSVIFSMYFFDWS
jgi:RNA polymerase sigma-70 factor (ECF subfamily)